MTLLEIMERVGSKETNKIRAYINDALLEIQTRAPQSKKRLVVDVVAGQRYYSLSTDMVKLIAVYQKYPSTTTSNQRYIRISRVSGLDIVQAT